jgi:hypothetical protein
MHFAEIADALCGRATVKPHWSISEACAWIVTRDLDAVEHVSNSDPEAVHFLLGGDALPPYRFCEHVLEWPASCASHALTQIQQYCGDERITMSGVPEDGSARKSIPAIEWADLLVSHSEVLAGWIAAAAPVGNPSTWWTRLRLLSADVQRVWPPIDAKLEEVTIDLAAASAPEKALTPGAGNTEYADAAQVARAIALFDAGTHKSARAAARSFMDDIPGDGDPVSKARRVADKALKVIRARHQ